MKRTRKERGITLIALIITIVVLLILAAVAIAAIQNNGIIEHAGNSANKYNEAKQDEEDMLQNYLDYFDVATATPTREDFFIIDEETGEITIAQDTSENHDGIGFYYDAYDNKILSEENVVIPSKINGTEVKSIMGDVDWETVGGFYCASNLKSVIIPDTVTEIDRGTFYNCTSLTKVILPSTLTSIGVDAFYGCTSLTEIKIPSSVKEIGTGAFEGCTSLIKITIPEGVTSIGSFGGCTSLTEIKIPKSVTSIYSSAFYNCPNLTKIIIEEGSTLTVPTNKWRATNATVVFE